MKRVCQAFVLADKLTSSNVVEIGLVAFQFCCVVQQIEAKTCIIITK
jgi:hypothetical protein